MGDVDIDALLYFVRRYLRAQKWQEPGPALALEKFFKPREHFAEYLEANPLPHSYRVGFQVSRIALNRAYDACLSSLKAYRATLNV